MLFTPGELTTIKFFSGYVCGFITGASLLWLAMKERRHDYSAL
jgi:hypothetical protein